MQLRIELLKAADRGQACELPPDCERYMGAQVRHSGAAVHDHPLVAESGSSIFAGERQLLCINLTITRTRAFVRHELISVLAPKGAIVTADPGRNYGNAGESNRKRWRVWVGITGTSGAEDAALAARAAVVRKTAMFRRNSRGLIQCGEAAFSVIESVAESA